MEKLLPAPLSIELRPTQEADLDFVLGLERDPDNMSFIGQWSREQHRDAIARADREHWILAEGPTRLPVGYLIAFDLVRERCGVYLKRIVVTRKGGGVGRVALRKFAEHAFADRAAPYLWLNVYLENQRGQRCYRSIGFEEFSSGADALARHDQAAGNGATREQSTLAMVLQHNTFTRASAR